MKISSVFSDGGQIPDQYGCHGANINPPLEFSDVPEKTVSLALLVDDSDALNGHFTHWLVFNMNPKTYKIAENSIPQDSVVGQNNFGDSNYGGPCPHQGTHHYHFRLFALNNVLDLPATAKKIDFFVAIAGHVISQAELIGTYSK